MSGRSRRLEPSRASDRIAAAASSGQPGGGGSRGSLGAALKVVAEPIPRFAENTYKKRR
jgi:hypothetical protein